MTRPSVDLSRGVSSKSRRLSSAHVPALASISLPVIPQLMFFPFDNPESARVAALLLFLLLTVFLWILLRRRAREQRKPLKATTGLGPLVLVFAVVVFLVWLNWPRGRLPGDSASAVGSLRTIHAAAITYASTYNNGYPPTLAAIAPPAGGSTLNCNAAGLIDEVLAGGRKNGYVFDYKPGEPVETPARGCTPGVQGYIITARPLKYGQTGMYNYFTDASGVIRNTSEDRPATKEDPPIAG